MLLLGLLGLGCVGTIDGEPERARPTDVVAVAATVSDSGNQGEARQPTAEAEPVSEALPLAAEPANTERSAAEGEPEVSDSAPAEAVQPTQPTPTLPEGCTWVDATSYVCPAACESAWPVPSAVNAEGWLDLYTPEGRQLCGGRVTDGCGRASDLPLGCTGDDACGRDEPHVCAECRVSEADAALAACAELGRAVAVVGCDRRADNQARFAAAGCQNHVQFDAAGKATALQCCDRAPQGID